MTDILDLTCLHGGQEILYFKDAGIRTQDSCMVSAMLRTIFSPTLAQTLRCTHTTKFRNYATSLESLMKGPI